MHQPLIAFALALAVHAEPGQKPAAEAVPVAAPGANIGYLSDYDDPPAGSPEELRLWKEGVAATRRILEVRRESFTLRAGARGADVGGRLTALRARADHERAEALEKLGRRFDRAWAENVDLYKRQWPVDPTRGCGYPHLYYDNALRLAPGRSRQAEVSNAAPELQTCVDRARVVCDQMAASNRRLAEVVREAEQAAGASPGKERTRPERRESREQEHEEHEHEEHEHRREGQ